eukprot:2741153-Pyramimonas_sp.AAC.1
MRSYLLRVDGPAVPLAISEHDEDSNGEVIPSVHTDGTIHYHAPRPDPVPEVPSDVARDASASSDDVISRRRRSGLLAYGPSHVPLPFPRADGDEVPSRRRRTGLPSSGPAPAPSLSQMSEREG